jgi:hypothetical protein
LAREEELEVREGEVVSELEGLEDEEEQSLGHVLDDSQGSTWDDVDVSLSGPNLDSYVHSAVLDDMFNWMLDQGFGVLTELLLNTGAYIKWKNDGTKLQVISDRSEKNKMDLMSVQLDAGQGGRWRGAEGGGRVGG